MNYIKICKIPSIKEYTDKWGVPTGVFYVEDIKGYVDETLWQDLYDLETYSAGVGKVESENASKFLSENPAPWSTFKESADKLNELFPIMSRLLKYGQLHQFNMRADDPNITKEGDVEFIRSFALFNVPTLMVWTPEYENKVLTLQKEVDRLNATTKGE